MKEWKMRLEKNDFQFIQQTPYIKVYSVLNPDPQKFEGASVWLSNGWPSTDGEIENFSFTFSKPSTLNQSHIKSIQILISSLLISIKSGHAFAMQSLVSTVMARVLQLYHPVLTFSLPLQPVGV